MLSSSDIFKLITSVAMISAIFGVLLVVGIANAELNCSMLLLAIGITIPVVFIGPVSAFALWIFWPFSVGPMYFVYLGFMGIFTLVVLAWTKKILSNRESGGFSHLYPAFCWCLLGVLNCIVLVGG